MKDLTEGPIPRHVVSLAVPMMIGMLLQALYFFVDLYFVARLGDAAIAGVSVGGNLTFVVLFLTQTLAVGTVSMVAQAVGRKDQPEANHVFNQAVVIGTAMGVVTLVGGYAILDSYAGFFAPDAAARDAGATFLAWYMPGMALQYAMVVLSSGLRGTGIVKPATAVQAITVVLNVILAPILIAGWGIGKPMGVAGAGLATSLSVAVGVAVLLVYFVKLEHYIALDRRDWRPKWPTWRKLFNIGLPAGGEFGMMAVFIAIFYWAARDFGTPAQGGLGIGFRVNQMVLLPALAIAFAAAPIVGQNFGAGRGDRVRETFKASAMDCAVVMALVTLVVQWKAEAMVRVFTSEPEVIAAAVEYMLYLSWNFVPSAFVLAASSVMQGMGNTWPALASTAIRIVTFALPTIWMAHQPWFQLRYMYTLSIVTVALQAVVSYLWLQVEFRKRLSALAGDRP